MIYPTYHIECDECQVRAEMEDDDIIPSGWFSGGGIDLCPDCLLKEKRESVGDRR